MFGSKKRLEELLHTYELLDKMYGAVKEKRDGMLKTSGEVEEKLVKIEEELKTLKDDVQELVNQYDSKLIDEVKRYLKYDVDKLLKEQNDLYGTIETHIRNSFIHLEARFGDLDKRIDDIYKEMNSYGFNVVKEVVPIVIKERMNQEIRKVLKAYLEMNLYAKAKEQIDAKI